MADIELDVAVVGAGVAGCYTAYRLLTGQTETGSVLEKLRSQAGGSRIGLFDYSGRIGGRMQSGQLPTPNGKAPVTGESDQLDYAEYGGFRFQEQMHIVSDLALYLQLDHEPFPVDTSENPVYVRGQRLTQSDLTKATAVGAVYDLTPRELELLSKPLGLSGHVGDMAFAGTLDEHGGFTGLQARYQAAFAEKHWAQVREYRKIYEAATREATVPVDDGDESTRRPLTFWSWWALQERFLSQEAISFMEDTGGYDSLASSGNAITGLMETFYFAEEPVPPDTTVWQHISSGYSDIPNKLYSEFEKAGGKTHTGYQLLSFEDSASGGYVLEFYNRGKAESQGRDLTTAQARAAIQAQPDLGLTVTATHVVLAMPKRSLELLDQSTAFFRNTTVRSLLFDSVENVTAFRLFMAYERPWWTAKGLSNGRSTTDLPVRQFYYWLTSRDNGASTVLASYSNARAETFWRRLQTAPATGDWKQDKLPGHFKQEGRMDAPAGDGPRAGTRTMASLAHAQLMEVVGVDDAPEPYFAHYQNWTKDPWGAGWHAWTAGQSSDELIPRIYQPLPGENVFVTGECWSNVQGWVQGALNTSETLVQTKFGLKWPQWLRVGGTWLGPGSPEPPLDTED